MGRTGAGKTALAEELGELINAELIACDKFYGYTYFKSSVCRPLSDYSSLTTHLIEYRHPLEPLLDRSLFADLANAKARQILDSGALPIAEGCSFGYITALLEDKNKRAGVQYGPLIGIRLPKSIDLPALYRQKVDQLLKEGAIKEVQTALSYGWQESYVMQKSMLAKPIADHLNGKISLEALKEIATENFLRIGEEEERKFMTIAKVNWIEHDPLNSHSSAARLASLLT
jgi:tRNA A37 N6-isopentenylltransferase MiaA